MRELLGSSVQMDDETNLLESGLDSLASMELRQSLSAQLGVQLPPTVMHEHPEFGAFVRSVEELCENTRRLGRNGADQTTAAAAGDVRASGAAAGGDIGVLLQVMTTLSFPPLLDPCGKPIVYLPLDSKRRTEAALLVCLPPQSWNEGAGASLARSVKAFFGGQGPAMTLSPKTASLSTPDIVVVVGWALTQGDTVIF